PPTKRRKSTCPGVECDRWWGTGRGANRREAGPMPGGKSSKEKKRRRSRSSGLDGGSGAGSTEGKRRSTESSYSLSEEIKCTVPSAEKEELAEEHSDIEEGGLDLSVSLKPVSFYIADKKEMLHQCFCVIGEKKLQKMLPDVLKNCSMEEIKRLCLDQLELLSEKKLLKILEGKNYFLLWKFLLGSLHCMIICYICVTGKGEDSDVLSINADAYDSDIEGPCNEEESPDVPESAVRSGAGQIDDLEKDIEKSVNEILGLAESSPKESKAANLAVAPSEDVQPSAQQLELLELEMRARAIKALMKAGDVKK
uniref:Caspase activity and apoptosis inhibitor 1 n=1 Tax=Chelonoidis abingdonii TaxID=106734 RepID=A0A8C0H3Z3_CHEAB